ncbi:hypothetical protein JTE90_016430 [Oedothorax gibbosus]|uniref:Uncharacterized protein n=1 Tax=Oedothorax gibbosus TaxID=931172 RepID=A0AAV6TDA7_9ARAC|nr:hypothetical protein JTE90_016430 [Oedothorax gibbosus]
MASHPLVGKAPVNGGHLIAAESVCNRHVSPPKRHSSNPALCERGFGAGLSPGSLALLGSPESQNAPIPSPHKNLIGNSTGGGTRGPGPNQREMMTQLLEFPVYGDNCKPIPREKRLTGFPFLSERENTR